MSAIAVKTSVLFIVIAIAWKTITENMQQNKENSPSKKDAQYQLYDAFSNFFSTIDLLFPGVLFHAIKHELLTCLQL